MSRTAFLFPGQGAQIVGMGKALVEASSKAKALFEQANSILGFDLLNLCLNGPKERLDATDVSQPAIFVASLAALEHLRESEPNTVSSCETTAGLSLGEYTSLVFAGALSFEDGLRVVKVRGEAMQAAAEATPSGMVSVLGFNVPEVEELVVEARAVGVLQIANYLCPGNTVVSGTREACDKLLQIAEARGARTVPLAVAGAFHTNLMKPADDKLAAALEQVTFLTPRIPIWSNVDGRPHDNPSELKSLLIRQVVSPVMWEDLMRGMISQGINDFVEIGPGRVLAGLLKRVDRKLPCRNISA
ncbi:ACP S-malonyltransferase [Telmatocola sphagniphila]|uniref:Malonyl CoA-acyl carrier protein transacylase n=1 Tax=Telmatocola sphagniphila TaxID=1123043 RepID=A0A8E6B707_9BACT|nr:ACP S-malonyltransferase [Telmatocola sphagniphila]QVL33285.1 ACP S-malonyltransferase [Telmatocola sphagniphila]